MKYQITYTNPGDSKTEIFEINAASDAHALHVFNSIHPHALHNKITAMNQPEKVNPIAYDFYYGKILDSVLSQLSNNTNILTMPYDDIVENIDRITRKILTLKGC